MEWWNDENDGIMELWNDDAPLVLNDGLHH